MQFDSIISTKGSILLYSTALHLASQVIFDLRSSILLFGLALLSRTECHQSLRLLVLAVACVWKPLTE